MEHESSLWSLLLHVSLPQRYKENTDTPPGPGLVGAWLGALPQACSTAALLAGRWTPKPSRAQPGVTLLKWQKFPTAFPGRPEKVATLAWPAALLFRAA